jgi:hypothetical protein
MIDRDVCARCMAMERVSSYKDFEQVGEPVPWRDSDEALWQVGEVECPHRRRNISHADALLDCLHRGRQIAVTSHVLFAEDERPV